MISMKVGSLVLVVFLFLGFATALFAEDADQSGEALFRKNCSACHPEGGNIFNKQKTLSKKDREMNKIYSADDIVKKMRNPGAFDFHPNQWSGMKVFDEQKLSDTDAKKIAEYIIGTFH